MKTQGSWRSRNPTLANVLAVAIAAALVAWPAYGVLYDDFSIPAGHLDGRDYHFHGAAAWLMFVGFACQAAAILIVVSLRLVAANPGGKAGQNVAVILASIGAFIILAMLFLKMTSLA
jgi:hypothetical protein